MVQWLRLCAFNAVAQGSIPGQRIKIPHATAKRKKVFKKVKYIKATRDKGSLHLGKQNTNVACLSMEPMEADGQVYDTIKLPRWLR